MLNIKLTHTLLGLPIQRLQELMKEHSEAIIEQLGVQHSEVKQTAGETITCVGKSSLERVLAIRLFFGLRKTETLLHPRSCACARVFRQAAFLTAASSLD
jgi:hypothetical protein